SGVKPEFELEYRGKFFSCTLAPVPTAGYVNFYASDITERKQAEEQLRESEERFRALVSQATAGISETDLEGRLIFVNAGFCEMLGYSEMELLGKTIWELTFTEDLEVNKRLFKRMVKQDKPYQFEKRFIRKDGSLLWTSVSVTVIHDSAGEPKGGVGVVLNLEKRKQAENALAEYARQQASLYRLSDELHHTESLTAVFDASLDAILNALQCDRASILLCDDSNVMRFVAWRGLSEGYRKATDGHSPWKPDERDPQPVVMDDVRTGELSESLRAIIEAEGIASLAFIPLVSNGRLIGKFMVYFDAPHAFEEGELDLGQTIARQLASAIDRKRAEVQLRESEERFRTLANAMPSIVWTAAPDGKITYANDQWFQYAGITPEENARGWPELILHPDDYERCVREWNHALETVPDEYLIEVRNRRYDGQYRWFQTRAVPVRDASGKALAWYGVTTDIHERIEAENRLALLAEISELLRNFDDPNDLMYKISEAVGEHLRLKRALFNEIDLEQDREFVLRDYHHEMESVAGIHKVSEYSSLTSSEMAAGKTVVNTDSKTDPRTARDYERTYALSGERAYVAVPLMRDNRWVASFWVSDDVPRQWTGEEVSLLETVAERTWAIIEKLRINTALRESEQRYRAVVESQAEMLCRFRPDGTILFVNSAYAQARGTTPEDLASRNFWGFVAEEDRPSVRAMLDSLTPEAPQVQIENRFYTTDGERWTLWTNRALSFDANGRWLEAQSSGIDITERKQVEEALRASEERMR
ncbi:MAG TPA: PAS domain S-box protein, partial [Anaerolineales bacterium]|nr:PAS domain S-box protein [Anaerolineales bacterium]